MLIFWRDCSEGFEGEVKEMAVRWWLTGWGGKVL